MNRTTAEALALVNWKGVFYARYGLDRHVTALEGTNGAGKTTVMIAAYLVLLPDLSRLRFTNLGETGATGGDKGIWGRLGEVGRPSYCAIEFALPDKRRLLAGVHLVRKGEPSVEATPFMLEGLEPQVRLQDLLLMQQGDHEAVPELNELTENAARFGGRLHVFGSARDYFAALFEQGVTPLRLGTDEERNKLNEMLRTSMTGGISRALTSELRSFLLKEEGGLANTVQRMRSNLEACRRTRTEVQEARRLEREIGEVFEAGHVMFAAAFLATRGRAEDLARRVAEAVALLAARAESLARAQESLTHTVEALEAHGLHRRQLGETLQAAQAWRRRLEEALQAARRLQARLTQLSQAQERAHACASTRDNAEADRTRQRAAMQRAEAAYEQAAAGLADLQRGLDEMHRRANAFRQTSRLLGEAEASLGGDPIPPRSFVERAAAARQTLSEVDEERRDSKTRLDDSEAHRRLHAEVMSALDALLDTQVTPETAYEQALSALQTHRRQLDLAGRLPAVERELAEARRHAVRQAEVRERARSLEVPLDKVPAVAPGAVAGDPPAGVRVGLLFDAAEAELRAAEEGQRASRASVSQAEVELKALQTRQAALAQRAPEFRALAAHAARLAETAALPVHDRATLDAARAAIEQRLTTASRAEESAHLEREELLRQARELLAQGGPFSPELIELKERLGAELLAESFEDVDLDEAGRIEACLGSLAQALVVEAPEAAAQQVGARAGSLDSVYLVARDADLAQVLAQNAQLEVSRGDIAAHDGLAVRVSRIPARPRLGRRAREERAAELTGDAARRAEALEGLRHERRQLQRLVEAGEALLAGHAVWSAGDPGPELIAVREALGATEALLAAHHAAADRHAVQVRLLRPRVTGLRVLLGEAQLLDPPDFAERTRALTEDLAAAQAAKVWAAQQTANAACIDRHQATLRRVPLTLEEVGALRERLQQLTRRREQLHQGIEAIEHVAANVEALGWGDAPARLAQEEALAPAMKRQLQEAEAHRRVVREAVGAAEVAYDAAHAAFQEAEGDRIVADRAHADAREIFAQQGVPEPTERGLAEASTEVARLAQEHEALGNRERELLITKGRQDAMVSEAGRLHIEADDKLVKERSEAAPAAKRWADLLERAEFLGLVGTMITDPPSALAEVNGQINLAQEAGEWRKALVERLKAAQGGAQLLIEINPALRPPSEGEFAASVLQLWLTVRNWLRRRLPAQVAEVDDPREALLRLRDQLQGLEERLVAQETALRGTSADVANSISAQVRKARTQVNRLNKNLEGVSFGSIAGIRVRQGAVEKMEQVLRALRDGPAQALLFEADLPIEDALDEIFRRFGGGRTGGQRLLDYREYIHLQVEIRRRVGAEWENANPGRLSTGEAIGVGAALMMVVLTEWERGATLFRSKKAHGSLRFLFLDEANRLSHDNLGVLFDLCQSLDLQLLIAAPEVARAEGNTTYRLVRKTTADGREEVVVSGRRTRAHE